MIQLDKQKARQYGLSARKLIQPTDKQIYDQRIFEKVKQILTGIKRIGIYVSINDEVDTRNIIQYCFDTGIEVFVPKCSQHTLTFHQICNWSDLEKGYFGLFEPITKPIEDIHTLEIMFVPLSSYDQSNQRTGYGKGYYDSILDGISKKIGLAYSVQQVKHIDVEKHDIQLDEVICEK